MYYNNKQWRDDNNVEFPDRNLAGLLDDYLQGPIKLWERTEIRRKLDRRK